MWITVLCLDKRIPLFKKNMHWNYSEVKGHNIHNLLSNGLEKKFNLLR